MNYQKGASKKDNNCCCYICVAIILPWSEFVCLLQFFPRSQSHRKVSWTHCTSSWCAWRKQSISLRASHECFCLSICLFSTCSIGVSWSSAVVVVAFYASFDKRSRVSIFFSTFSPRWWLTGALRSSKKAWLYFFWNPAVQERQICQSEQSQLFLKWTEIQLFTSMSGKALMSQIRKLLFHGRIACYNLMMF